MKYADPKQQQASLALSTLCLTIVPAHNRREICPEELQRVGQLPMETADLCVSEQRHTDAVFSLTFTLCFCRGRKQGGDEGFSVPRGKKGAVKGTEEWPTCSTLLNFKCFFLNGPFAA